MTDAEFRHSIEAFLRKSHMPATHFGREAMGDPNFVFDLRKGRRVSLATMERCEKFMSRRRHHGSKGETSETAGPITLNLAPEVISLIARRARTHARSLEAEAEEILTQAMGCDRSELARWAERLKDRLRERYHGDATADIRADRDR